MPSFVDVLQLLRTTLSHFLKKGDFRSFAPMKKFHVFLSEINRVAPESVVTCSNELPYAIRAFWYANHRVAPRIDMTS